WLTDKNTPWVLSAISSAFTKMDFEIWNTSRNNTNVNESAHHNINLDGTSLSLLAAIKKAEEFDNREWNAASNFEKYNVSTSGKNKSQVQKFNEASKRKEPEISDNLAIATSSRSPKRPKK
ncbi:17877_t:CDS:2, partial [Funneliformis geosporum]